MAACMRGCLARVAAVRHFVPLHLQALLPGDLEPAADGGGAGAGGAEAVIGLAVDVGRDDAVAERSEIGEAAGGGLPRFLGGRAVREGAELDGGAAGGGRGRSRGGGRSGGGGV